MLVTWRAISSSGRLKNGVRVPAPPRRPSHLTAAQGYNPGSSGALSVASSRDIFHQDLPRLAERVEVVLLFLPIIPHLGAAFLAF